MSLLFKTVHAVTATPPKTFEGDLGNTFFNYNTTLTLKDVFQNTTSFLFSLAVFFVIIFLAFSGLQFITSAGDKAKLDTAKNSFKYSVIAILILLGLWLIVNFLTQMFGGGSSGITPFDLPVTSPK